MIMTTRRAVTEEELDKLWEEIIERQKQYGSEDQQFKHMLSAYQSGLQSLPNYPGNRPRKDPKQAAPEKKDMAQEKAAPGHYITFDQLEEFVSRLEAEGFEVVNKPDGTRQAAPEKKDMMRLMDIMIKSKEDPEKAKQFARNMAKAIKDVEKAKRRAEAAEQLGFDDLAAIFWARHKELSSAQPLAASFNRIAAKLLDKGETELASEVLALSDQPGPFDGSKKQKPTTKHRPAIWEDMLGTVAAMNDAGKVQHFDYDYKAARAFAGVDEPDRDLRLWKVETQYQGWPRKGKLVLWALKK
jgi:hypothetical protein